MPSERKRKKETSDQFFRLTFRYRTKDGTPRSVSIPAKVSIHQSALCSENLETRLPIQTTNEAALGTQDHRNVTSAKAFLESLQKEYMDRLSTKSKRRS